MADYSNLKQKAQEVRNETKAGANTANRVGYVLEEIVKAIEAEKLDTYHEDGTNAVSIAARKNILLNITSADGKKLSELYLSAEEAVALIRVVSSAGTSLFRVDGGALTIQLPTSISINVPSLNLGNVRRIYGAYVDGFQTSGDININAKTRISAAVDTGELKVLQGATNDGFVLRTVNDPHNTAGLNLIELLCTDGYNSRKYTFPAQSGEVALKSDIPDVSGKQDTLTLATGLEWGKTNLLQVKMNTPLNYDNSGRLILNYDSTLTVSDGKLGVRMYGIIDNKGGLTFKNNGLAVDVGRGLKIDSCQVVVDYGTGLSVANNQVYVDTSKIAGEGVDITSDYKTLTIGTKAAQALAGAGLMADGPKMKVKYGSGLTTNSCGGLIVDAAKLTVGNATNATYLDGFHASYYTPRDRSVNGKDMNAQKESAIYTGYSMKNSAAQEVSSFLLCRYSDDWGAQMQFSLVSGKVYVRFWQNAGGIMGTWKELAYKDGTVARATADASGNNIVETYARRFMPTNGLEINSDRELFLPNLTASVVNGAVDGVKNNNQRVLNLSCGAIQIKLSTGLAIDDSGYLYVQDKYVTK